MKRQISKLQLYTLYFWEYLRFGELSAIKNSLYFLLTNRSKAKAAIIRSRMGVFETRANSIDFQFINYAYELSVKKFIEKETFDVFMDVGACLGEFSVWLSKKGKKCFAFEPVKSSYELIERNMALNDVSGNMKSFNFGLGEAHSLEYFELNDQNPGCNRMVEKAGKNTQKFEVCALDDITDQLHLKTTDKILIKIDIEGMELPMLKGASQFLRMFPNTCLIIEEKFTGQGNIRKLLDEIADFEYGPIDEYNMFARRCLHKG